MKRSFFFFVFILFFTQIVCAQEMYPVWERYVKPGKVEYKNLDEISAKDLPLEENVLIPLNIYKTIFERKEKYNSSHFNYDLVDERFADKLLNELKKRGFEDLEKLGSLSAGDILRLTTEIVAENIIYQDVHYRDMILMPGNPSFKECFVAGCGTCNDYALSFESVFEWFKNYNNHIQNFFILYTSDPTYRKRTDQEVKDMLYNLKMETHAWNILVIFSNEKLIYSHFDLTMSNGEYGLLQRGEVGLHLSKSNYLNLANLLAAVGEFEPAYKLMNKEYFVQNSISKPSDDEKVLQLLRLIHLSEELQRKDLLCKQYNELIPLIQDNFSLKKSRNQACLSDNL